MNYTVRKASSEDIDFLIEGIMASEKSGTDVLSYCRLFDISENEFIDLVKDIFEEEIEDQEWYINAFWIAEAEGLKAACLSAWVEPLTGLSSAMRKSQAMSYFLGDRWVQAGEKLQLASSIQIHRTRGFLQLENIYAAPAHRRKGLASWLIDQVLISYSRLAGGPENAEIQLMGDNEAALRSYTKCGFLEMAKSPIGPQEMINLLPGTFKVSLSKKIR